MPSLFNRSRQLLIFVMLVIVGTFGVLNLACSTVHNLVQPYLLTDGVQRQSDLTYLADSSNPRHRLDLFRPATAATGTKGLVIFIHGGFWKNQDRRYLRPFTGLYWNIGYALAADGYDCAVISYRIYPEQGIDGQLADVRAAFAWAQDFQRSQNASPDAVVLMGHSAGGHLAMLAGLRQTQAGNAPMAVVALSPILDIEQMRNSQSAEFNREVTDAIFPDTAEARAAYSPGPAWSTLKSAPPLLILSGAQDLAFIRQQIADFSSTAAAKSQTQIRIQELSGLDHADLVLDYDAANGPGPRVTQFLNQLGGGR